MIATCTPCTVVSRSSLMSLIITFMFEPAKLQMNCASARGARNLRRGGGRVGGCRVSGHVWRPAGAAFRRCRSPTRPSSSVSTLASSLARPSTSMARPNQVPQGGAHVGIRGSAHDCCPAPLAPGLVDHGGSPRPACSERLQRRGAQLLPIVTWLPGYERRYLRGDVIAGIAVTALIVPKNLGYAGIAGIPLENGLYAAAAGAILYALFCTSRQISTGPSSSLAAVAGGAVLATGVAGDEAAQLVAAIALVTGLLFVLVAIFRLGRIAQFLSKAVVTGFLAGAAIDVTIGELAKLTGTSSDGDSSWQELSSWIRGLGEVHWATVLVGAVSLLVIFGLRVVAPKVPGALVLVVGGLLASWILDLGSHGVALVGDVPRGLPSPALPGADVFADHSATIAAAAFALLADRLLADRRRRARSSPPAIATGST